jgi:hypothetical protein
MKKLSALLIVNVLMLVLAAPVLADGETVTEKTEEKGGFKETTRTICTTTGSYGETSCRDEVIKEEIKRDIPEEEKTEVLTPDTGIAEVAMVVTALFGGGMAFFVLAQKQLS